MKLKNKKTGEIGYLQNDTVVKRLRVVDANNDTAREYTSLAELNAEWKDYHEEYWHITWCGDVVEETDDGTSADKDCKVIGNRFETKEEAEKAVEKLKAWKRLKDKGFRFTLTPGVGSLDIAPGKFQIEITADMPEKWFCCDAVQEDLDACFGGEE